MENEKMSYRQVQEIARELTKGYSPREISCIAHGAIIDEECSSILENDYRK